MYSNSGLASLERQLLALEGMPADEFVEAVCRLTGAEHLLLFAPAAGTEHRLALSTPLPDSARDVIRTSRLDPASHVLLFPLCGRFVIAEHNLRAAPFADYFSSSRWAMAGVGESWSFSVVLFGSGAAPTGIVEDPVLSSGLMRRLAEQAGAGRAGAQAAVEVLSRLSHEFKTPLVSIKGYAELILDQRQHPVDPKLREWIRRIAGGANRLAALYRKATAEARTEMAWSYEPRAIDPSQWLRSCLEEASSLASGRRLDWRMDAEEGLVPVAVDPEAARDLLLELFQNAARSTPDGGRIEVRARSDIRDGRPGVRVTVEDTGVGIPGGAADHLFERFATLTHGLEHHSGDFEFGAGGLGLGLALVRGVARAHGGEAWAEGNGRDARRLPGCSFHVWLPASGAEAELALPKKTRGRLLVIDPDPQIRQILRDSLSVSYEVVSASTTREGLGLWSSGRWDACLVEPRIPDGGADLVLALRSTAGEDGPPVLAYTSGSASQAAAWRAAGADGCVSKPARARLLLQRLRSLSARKSRR